MNPLYKKIAIIAALSILALVLFNFVRTMFLNIKASANLLNTGLVFQTAENAIAEQTGLAPSRINELKNAASKISVEIETGKDLSSWDTLGSIVQFKEAKKILINVRSVIEMQTVAAFYKDLFTNSNSLYNDLQTAFSTDQLTEIPYLSSIA
jgi:hypothetical protein